MSKIATLTSRLIIILLTSISINSCFTFSPTSTGPPGGLFETFYAGDEGTQYFIKPLSFKHKDNNKELNIDFTFRYKDTTKDSVIINHSILSENIYKNLDSLKINSNNDNIILENIEHMFSQKKRKVFNSRFTTKEALPNIINLFNHNDWEIIVYNNGESIYFETPRRTRRKISNLEDDLFVLF